MRYDIPDAPYIKNAMLTGYMYPRKAFEQHTYTQEERETMILDIMQDMERTAGGENRPAQEGDKKAMERLTEENRRPDERVELVATDESCFDICAQMEGACDRGCPLNEAYQRLQTYEDIGTPEEFAALKEEHIADFWPGGANDTAEGGAYV